MPTSATWDDGWSAKNSTIFSVRFMHIETKHVIIMFVCTLAIVMQFCACAAKAVGILHLLLFGFLVRCCSMKLMAVEAEYFEVFDSKISLGFFWGDGWIQFLNLGYNHKIISKLNKYNN